MSYLRNCENDLFISYAHFDDAPMFEGQKGWIEVFHQALEVRLRQLLGEEAFVWRDPKLTGNEYFEETLEKRLLKTALLLSVVSPRYVKSKSCLDEIDAFCRGAAQSGGIRFQDKARLLKVVKTEVPRQEMPSPLQPLLGYEFYATRSGQAAARIPAAADGRRRFVQGLPRHARGPRLRHQADAGGVAQFGVADTAKDVDAARVVYIADTVLELRPQSDQLRRELRQRGYVVYPCEARAGERRPISRVRRRRSSGGRACRCTCWEASTASRWKAKADRRSRCRSRNPGASRRRAACGECCGFPRT